MTMASDDNWGCSVWIARAPGDIWDFLVDVAGDSSWHTGAMDARWISAPPYGVGSTGMYLLNGSGPCPWQVTVWREPLDWVNSVTGGHLRGAQIGYHIAPERAGSRVRLYVRPPSGLLMRVRAPFLKSRMMCNLEGHLDHLKTFLEN